MSEEIETRISKITSWIKNPYNLILIGILLFGLALRIFLFVKTLGQAGWYDEMDMMSMAKSWAFGIPYEYNMHRPPLFQLFAAALFWIGLNDSIIKLLIVLVPSTILIFAVYLLGKEMYNKEVGLIAAFLTSVSWTLVFWTERFQPDSFSVLFQVLAVLFMWKFWKEQNLPLVNERLETKYIVLAKRFSISLP